MLTAHSEDSERRVVQCNYLEGTSACAKGARAFVVSLNGGADRLEILARSRSGRWIRKWERWDRLGNFRMKTIVPTDPVYDKALLVGLEGKRAERFVSGGEGPAEREI